MCSTCSTTRTTARMVTSASSATPTTASRRAGRIPGGSSSSARSIASDGRHQEASVHRTVMRIVRPFATTLAVAAVAGAVSIARPAAQTPVRVRVQTELGDIVLEIDTRRAPNTAANFLRYLNAGHYDGGTFHRTVKMDNQPDSPVKIEVIQAGVNPDRAKDGFAPIPIERTSATGLHHTDGVISMARGQ